MEQSTSARLGSFLSRPPEPFAGSADTALRPGRRRGPRARRASRRDHPRRPASAPAATPRAPTRETGWRETAAAGASRDRRGCTPPPSRKLGRFAGAPGRRQLGDGGGEEARDGSDERRTVRASGTSRWSAAPAASESLISVRPVGARDIDPALAGGAPNAQQPRIAADFAVLHERTFEVRVEVDFHLFAAIRDRRSGTRRPCAPVYATAGAWTRLRSASSGLPAPVRTSGPGSASRSPRAGRCSIVPGSRSTSS